MNRETFAIKLEGPKSKIERIEQALRDVQAQMPESEGVLPFTHCIPSAAREIYLSWRRHEAPSRKPSQWHKQFQTNVEGILKLLREMPAELVEDVFQNFEQKSQLHQRLVWALANSKLNPPHKAGRRAKLETRRLAIMVATFFYSLTRRPPTVTRINLGPDHPRTRNGSNFPSGGEFFDLLATIFGILEVKDDPRTAAEFVRDNWQAIDKTPGSTVGVASVATAKRRGNWHQKAPIDRL